MTDERKIVPTRRKIRKIVHSGKVLDRIDPATVAEALGAESVTVFKDIPPGPFGPVGMYDFMQRKKRTEEAEKDVES